MRRMRLIGAALAVATLGLASTSVALAGGNGAQTFTQHDHGLTMVIHDVNPCTGAPATITLVVNDVFHGTINKTGSWFTGTLTGTFSFVPVDPSQPSYTGRFTTWFGDENNLHNDVEHSTFNLHHGVGSDGSILRVHDNAQATMNANGVITVSFDKFVCG